MTDLSTSMLEMGRRARAAATALREAPAAARTRALTALSERLAAAEADILSANARDVEAARAGGMTEALIDRLSLSPARITGMVQAVATIAAVPDPLGVETERWTPANGLDIARVRTPIGVLAITLTTGMNTDVSNYMFGSILSLSRADAVLSVALSAVVLAVFVLLYPRIFAVTFDETFAKATGTRAGVFNMLIALLTAITVVLGVVGKFCHFL